ncbi:primosomal protein N' [Paenisporosarcina cavernae]|uniref:Replication restart protein PriA n=1 Tax=Paenisporosarcina cavernae TaxID=2320858 RepID=A0A385YUP2_9BACL|nr:primosomal protein N' [Paenisporosarcina cavernae]AYC29193.1 primosomal protein N' [Paenisporosarcina cavernae]
MIAEVIVDIATSAIDRKFDYLVPERYTSVVQVGSRVKVPFGPREIMGFIVGLKEETDVDIQKQKELMDVVDLHPLLTTEMMELAKWVKQDTLCLEIDVLQMMLPAALRSTYEKVVVLEKPDLIKDEELIALFGSKNFFVLPKDIDSTTVKKLKRLADEGILSFETVMKQKTAVKKIAYLELSQDTTIFQQVKEALTANAKKQLALLDKLASENRTSIAMKEITNEWGFTKAVVDQLVQKGIGTITEKEVYREPVDFQSVEKKSPLQMTEEQQIAYEKVLHSFEQHRAETFLLHGITGSGKTEIYLQMIAHALSVGKQAIMLVPEIALTPQMTERFVERFGSQVAVLHSGLSAGEKYDQWRKIHRSEVKVVVGARSAIFAPFENVGVIIMDEEHESTYKQEDSPRYHARDIAIWRSEYHNCPVILGSATPSLESFARAQKGVYTLLTLVNRPKSQPLPPVQIVDMREEMKKGNRSVFSIDLVEAMRNRFSRNEQVVLLLNKRGYSSFVLCRDCGTVMNCPSCDISLTYHRANERMKCHYCAYENPVPTSCPSCQSDHIRFFGSGTQKIEEEIAKLFPAEKMLRMDVDTTRKKGAHASILQAFGNQEASILLGTQMIAKGLDFPNVTLVGVLSADTALFVPDFRAAEKTFQLLAQVSGRAGRHDKEGNVILQTYSPEHYAIQFSKAHDYQGFYRQEMFYRHEGKYPPYTFIGSIIFSHEDLLSVSDYAMKSVQWLRENLPDSVEVIGPSIASISRLQNRYRYQCLLKYRKDEDVGHLLHQLQNVYKTHYMKNGYHLSITKNPSVLM